MTIKRAQQLALWADELRSIANAGLRWSHDNPYDASRYQRVLRIAAEVCAAQDVRDADAIEDAYKGDLSHLTPYATGDAAIFNDQGQILLIQRNDDHLWAMPGGMYDVGETAAEGSCREAFEETGLRVEPVALIGVYDSRRYGSRTRAHLYQFVFACRMIEPGAQPIVTHETLDVGWFGEDDLPPLSIGHTVRVPDAFRWQRGSVTQAIFDRSASM